MKRSTKIISLILSLSFSLSLLMGSVMLPQNAIVYPGGTAGVNSQDLTASDTKTYSINYDPNDNTIHYGVIGEVGAKAENDTNNDSYKNTKYHLFPSYYETLKDSSGKLMFPNSTAKGYDYTEMLTYAINEQANNAASGKDGYEIRIEEGVYYFGGTIKVWGEFHLNGVYGKTIFVCESSDTALFKAATNQTYYQGGSITDITFVAKDAHSSFNSNSSASSIQSNVLSPSIKPISNYYCFEGMNISWFRLKNCTISGFAAPLKQVKGHMCSHIQDNTFGPCLVALDGTHFIDCFIYDNYFYGGVIEKDGHIDLPLFTTGIGPNLTTISNNYIKSFFYGKGVSDTYGVTYSNNTYENVYSINFYSPGTSVNAVSGCLFKNCSYKAIATMFESLGYKEYNKFYKGSDAYVIHTNLYDNRENEYNKMTADGRSCIINLVKGTAITGCRFEEADMTDTDLFRFGYFKNEYKSSIIPGVQIMDNSYKLSSYKKDDIISDNINPKNNSMSSQWHTKYYLSKKSSKDACIYYDPYANIKIDLSCFYDPSSNETLGYRKLGDVGADEEYLNNSVALQYYKDLKAGRKIVYLTDFGATADDGGGDSPAIQKAFDTIAKTGDILIVEGTFTITTPILLRGGSTYRVVCNGGKNTQNEVLVGGGFSLDVGNSALKKAGGFVQDCSDTGKISGYFLNMRVYPDNVGHVKNTDKEGVVFYQVRFDKMHISNYRFGYMEAAFEECTIDNSVIEEGYNQYNPYGIMKRCIVSNSAMRYSYGTGSLCDYGVGYTYAYYLTDTDIASSSFRGNWIEFMQMTNGFKLKGNGNSIYTGNVFDYVWNFQFGKNDIFIGNNLTHCATTSVTNHLAGPDNIPRDAWSTEIKAGNITQMHVSDGVKIVGNIFSDGETRYTTYFCFDGRTTLYNKNGKTVSSISNARIAANLSGHKETTPEMVQVLPADILIKDNCKNNQIDLTSMAKGGWLVTENQVYNYTPDTYHKNIIPGTLVWLWCGNTPSLYYYPESKTGETLTPIYPGGLIFDLKYELDDMSGDRKGLTIYDYDFAKSDSLVITDKNGSKTKEAGGITASYLKRTPFISPFNTSIKKPQVSVSSADKNPDSDNVKTLFSEVCYLNSEPNANKGIKTLPPLYIFADTAHKDKYMYFEADMTIPLSGNPTGDTPVIIYAEDSKYYYGIKVGLQNNYALRSYTFKMEKALNGKQYGVNKNTGGVLPIEWGKMTKVTSTDISVRGSGKPGNNVSGNMYTDGTDTELSNSICSISTYDPSGINAPVIGMKAECNYNYGSDTVDITAVLDFSSSYKVNDGAISKRKVTLGTFSIKDLNTLPGIMYFTDVWTESISYGIDKEFDRNKDSGFDAGSDNNEYCPHIFSEYIRVKPSCLSGGYDSYICSRCKVQISYTELSPLGHDFSYTEQENKILCHCERCGHEEYRDNIPAQTNPPATDRPSTSFDPIKPDIPLEPDNPLSPDNPVIPPVTTIPAPNTSTKPSTTPSSSTTNKYENDAPTQTESSTTDNNSAPDSSNSSSVNTDSNPSTNNSQSGTTTTRNENNQSSPVPESNDDNSSEENNNTSYNENSNSGNTDDISSPFPMTNTIIFAVALSLLIIAGIVTIIIFIKKKNR